jgi:hypothetical protein
MAKIKDAEGLYGTLGYNFDDPNGAIEEFPQNTLNMLDKMPTFMDSWMAQDVRDNNVGGYFTNPCSTNTSIIISAANNIYYWANGCSGLETVANISYTLLQTSTNFLAHTNRISGVTPLDPNDLINPYYRNAVNNAKQIVYITNQTDDISNTSVLMGSFTSILVSPQIGANAAIFAPYSNTVQSSVTTTTDPESGDTTKSSSLGSSTKTTLNTLMTNINTFLSTRQTHDVNYFANIKTMVSKVQSVTQFKDVGNSESALLKNYVGSSKLLDRIG